MPERVSPEKINKDLNAESHDMRHELQCMTDEELLDWLDDLRSGAMKPAIGPDEASVDKAHIAEARRRAYLLNEAADEAEKVITRKT